LGRRMSRLIAALTLGSSMPFLLFACGGRFGPRVLLLAASGLAAVGAAVVAWGLTDGPFRREAAAFDGRAAIRAFGDRSFRLQAFGYFGHMWELYAYWSLSAGFLSAALAGTPFGSGRSVSLIVFFVFLAGVGGCLAGGALAGRRGEREAARASLWISGGCCALSPLFFGLPAWAVLPFAWLWGAAAIADSAPFSGLAAGFSPPAYIGTALTIQNGIGFAVTVVSIQSIAAIAPLIGWRWAFLFLLPGPVLGAWAVEKLRNPSGPAAGRGV